MVHNAARVNQPTIFSTQLRERANFVQSWLCVGLDPDVTQFPAGYPRTPAGVVSFCRHIIDATYDLVAAFKINFAFFEALGPEGWRALDEVRNAIPAGLPVIADAKRGDIANTAEAYARSIFEHLRFDAVTVSPYLGWDSITPFSNYVGKGVFVLCKTSNPGASALQDAMVGNEPLYIKVAREGLELDTPATLGFVVGATQPAALRAVRALSEDLLLLVPGVGAQGAQPGVTLQLSGNRHGANSVVSVSRDILFASSGRDFAEAARVATEDLAKQLWMDQGPSYADR